jgi:hypothetical protein
MMHDICLLYRVKILLEYFKSYLKNKNNYFFTKKISIRKMGVMWICFCGGDMEGGDMAIKFIVCCK